MTSSFGRETIIILEIDQKRCSRTYGVAPCAAALGTTGERKCFNTLGTCQDTDNYLEKIETIRFGRPQDNLLQYGYIIPSLQSLSTTPARINLGGMDRNQSPFGERESINAKLADHLHSDLGQDDYRLERITGAAQNDGIGYNPYEQGTFWGKWPSRHKYYGSYAVRVREGFVGDALEDMRVRHYILDKIDGPNNGTVSLVAKDLFTLVEAKKAVAPRKSKGRLTSDINAAATAATLSPTGIGDEEYPASGYVRIGDEVCAFTRSGDNLTLTRGQLNTQAENHDGEDTVQLVLHINAQTAVQICEMLLTEYSEVPASSIPIADWQAEADAAGMSQVYTAYITEPTPVEELIGELQEQAGFTLWPDVESNKIVFSALRAKSPSFEVEDDAWIIADSITVKRRPDKRVSQVWVYYNQHDPTRPLDEETNYGSVYVDPDIESEQRYGSPRIHKVFSRWIPLGGRTVAARVADRLSEMFVDPPIDAKFALHVSRADQLALAQHFTLTTSEVQDETGQPLGTTQAIISIERSESRLELESMQINLVPVDPNAPRVIYIESNAYNLNLRTIHDSLYAAPTGSESIEFIIEAGVIIGSTSTSSPAVRTGTWGAVVPRLTNHGRIQGKGGAGGNAQYYNGGAGEAGGDALLVEDEIELDNTDGFIWGGGGGGGAGGSAFQNLPNGENATYAGGGGGGGQGTNGGNAGSTVGSLGATYHNPGNNGSPGSSETAGSGGQGARFAHHAAGDGGAGGGPGLPGSSGGTASVGDSPIWGIGGSGGAAGRAVVGNSLVTWISAGGADSIKGAII